MDRIDDVYGITVADVACVDILSTTDTKKSIEKVGRKTIEVEAE